VAVLLLAAIGEAHAERSAEQRGFDIVHAQRVAAQQRLHEPVADEGREAGDAAGMYHYRSGHNYHLLLLTEGVAHQSRGLAHGCFHLALRGNAVRHEGKREPVAFLRFGHHADAAQPHHHPVALAQIAQAAANGAAVSHHDHGVHALLLHFDPLLAVPYVGAMVGGGVEILGGALVPLYGAELGIARIHRRAAQLEQCLEKASERHLVRCDHLSRR